MSKLEEYESFICSTACHPGAHTTEGFITSALVTMGEAGELCDVAKRVIYDQGTYKSFVMNADLHKRAVSELGDLFCCLVLVAQDLGVTLTQVAEISEAKIRRRVEDGTLLKKVPEYDDEAHKVADKPV